MPRAPPSLFSNVAPEYVAVIFASSTGSRLFPVTSAETPKHMMPLAGIPVISRLLTSVETSGFQECIVVLSHSDPVTMAHLKTELVGSRSTNESGSENDANKSNSSNSNAPTSGGSMNQSYNVASSKPNLLILESGTFMKISVLTLPDDSQGSIDALRKVEEMGIVPPASNLVVLPGDLVVFDSSVISNLCDTHRQGQKAACTVLLTDVGEQDEQGAPLKESAKVNS